MTAEPTHQDLLDWFGEYEDLDPELEDHLNDGPLGPCIQHPLVYSIMHTPLQNSLVNRQLQHKLEALDRARNEADWHSYVFLHERPWRLDALVDVMTEMTPPRWWELFGTVWIDSENIRENYETWTDLLRSGNPDHMRSMMSNDEMLALDALPDAITIYQGHTSERDDGWSWTTRLETAAWFARRFASLERDEAMLSTAWVPKTDVVAYLLSRNEYEILVDPDNVRDIETAALPHNV